MPDMLTSLAEPDVPSHDLELSETLCLWFLVLVWLLIVEMNRD
jgi:hypothetical protein